MDTEKSSDAVRRARKELHDKVRSDWDLVLAEALPNPSPEHESEHDDTSGVLAVSDTIRYPFRRKSTKESQENEEAAPLPGLGGDALEWRERTYASSDPSSDEEDIEQSLAKRYGFSWWNGVDADAGGDAADDELDDRTLSRAERKKESRKRRRRRRHEDEMSVNPGLRYWEERRDVWCRAQRFPAPSSASASSLSATSSLSQQGLSQQSSASSTSQSQNQTTLLPVAHSILPPTDPTRPKINPTTYGSIYTKLVTQSLAPSVPINLSHVVPALVQGWKDAGEWPPKPSSAAVTATTAAAADAGKTTLGLGLMARRRLRIVDDAKGRGRRLLGHATFRTDAARAAADDCAPGLKEQLYDMAGPAPSPTIGGSYEREIEGSPGTGTSTAESMSSLHVRRNVARVGKALRGGLG